MRIISAVLLATWVVGTFTRGAAAEEGKKTIVFIAGTPSHGFAEHEHNADCMLLAKRLKEGMPGLRDPGLSQRLAEGADALNGADAIIMDCDGGEGTW